MFAVACLSGRVLPWAQHGPAALAESVGSTAAILAAPRAAEYQLELRPRAQTHCRKAWTRVCGWAYICSELDWTVISSSTIKATMLEQMFRCLCSTTRDRTIWDLWFVGHCLRKIPGGSSLLTLCQTTRPPLASISLRSARSSCARWLWVQRSGWTAGLGHNEPADGLKCVNVKCMSGHLTDWHTPPKHRWF